jgi:hypothetical protein
MKIISLFLLLLCLSVLDIQAVVNEFHELSTKESELIFIDTHKELTNPSVLAYVYAIEMRQAEYKINPIIKLNIFNKTKKKLNQLIINNPDNIHLRYIRLMLQEKAPSILGYTNFIDEDKFYIKEKLKLIDDSDYLDIFIYKNTSL